MTNMGCLVISIELSCMIALAIIGAAREIGWWPALAGLAWLVIYSILVGALDFDRQSKEPREWAFVAGLLILRFSVWIVLLYVAMEWR